MRIKALACAAALSLAASGSAFAFDAASDSTNDATGPGAGAQDAGARSAKSIECSQKADAKDLHGKTRKHFMRDCKHGS
jgi:psiF repeat